MELHVGFTEKLGWKLEFDFATQFYELEKERLISIHKEQSQAKKLELSKINLQLSHFLTKF